MSIIVCRTRPLTLGQADRALRRGLEVNPANAVEHAALAPVLGGRCAVCVGSRW